MVHFRDLYVAVGKVGPYDAGESDAAVFVSENGIDWEQITSDSFGGPGQQRMNSIALGGPGLVAAGFEDLVPGVDMEADAAVWVSSDARTWERVRDPGLRSAGTHEEIHNIVAAGPGLVASGWGYDADEDWDTQVWISPDGFQWERITQGFDTPGFQSVFDGGSAHSATNASTIVIVGRHNPKRGPWLPAIWVSANGRTWESASLDIETQGELVGVTANADGQGFVAVGFTYSNEAEVDALVLTSDDGRSWQRVTSPSLERPGTQRMLGVIQYGRGYVAVGGGADNSQDFVPMIWHSPNGLDWEQINSPQIDQAPVEWASHAVSTSTGLIIHTLGPDLLIGIATQPN
jgi:hypothetical protein